MLLELTEDLAVGDTVEVELSFENGYDERSPQRCGNS